LSDDKPLLFTTSVNILTITNLREHPAEGPFTIIVRGVKSPKSPPAASALGFDIETNFQGKIIN
jgi:hypothetical protein